MILTADAAAGLLLYPMRNTALIPAVPPVPTLTGAHTATAAIPATPPVSAVPALTAVLIGLLIGPMIGLSGCRSSRNTLHILTDRAELAIAAEIFSSEREGVQVTLRHAEGIDAASAAAESADLIIASHLNTPGMLEGMRPAAAAAGAEVYPALEGPRNSRGGPLLHALAFELPLIIGTQESLALLPDPVVVQPEELRAAAPAYIMRTGRGGLTRMSFSPAWNPRLFTDLLAIRTPAALPRIFEEIEDASVNTVMDEILTWREAAAGSGDADRVFSRKYRYLPGEVLVMQGRIQFARMDFAGWASLPHDASRILDMRYLSGPRRIPISEITWGGIPKRSANPRAAEEFLEWLLLPETQVRLMDRWEREGLTVFGFLGGLSSIPEVNYTRIIDLYPRMEGMIPENHYLAPPPAVPHRWRRIRDEVVYPWFRAAMDSDSPHEKLSEAYNRWDLFSLQPPE